MQFIGGALAIIMGTAAMRRYLDEERQRLQWSANSGELEKLGFSIQCLLAANAGAPTSDLISPAEQTPTYFGQVLVGRFFVDRDELAEARRRFK